MLLQLEGVIAGYGSGSDILRGVDLSLDSGGFTCLIGPNGAGKSTLLRTISGLLRPRQGRILFRGRDIGGRRPDLLFRDGIAHVPQGRSSFAQMTVWENVLMGGYSLADQRQVDPGLTQAAELFPIVREQRHKAAGLLSGGEQKQVEIARAMVRQPTLLLLDEPTLGLEPRAARGVERRRAAHRHVVRQRRIGQTGQRIDHCHSRAGIEREGAFLHRAPRHEGQVGHSTDIEQNARMGLSAAKWGCIMELGTIKLQGMGDQLLNDPQVKRLYLGQAAESA